MRTWILFEEPDSCKLALCTNLWVRHPTKPSAPHTLLLAHPRARRQSVFLILLSAVVACVETLPAFHKNEYTEFWFGLEAPSPSRIVAPGEDPPSP
jgi:hypothetical protein